MALAATVGQITTGLMQLAEPAVVTKDRRGPSLDADAQIVEQCLAGDSAAWEDLVRTHTRRVYAICYRFTGSDHRAQDLTQEVFLRVFRTLGSYRAGEGAFTVWLGRLTRNLLIDNYRKEKYDRATGSIEEMLPMIEERSSSSSRTDSVLEIGRAHV